MVQWLLNSDREIKYEQLTSSSGVKSLTMLKSFRISSGVFPLIILATVLHPTSLWAPTNLVSFKKVSIKNEIDVQKRFDVEVIGGKNYLEKHFLIDRDKLLVPFADVRRPFARFVLGLVCVRSRQRLTTMVFAVLENLGEYESVSFPIQGRLSSLFSTHLTKR